MDVPSAREACANPGAVQSEGAARRRDSRVGSRGFAECNGALEALAGARGIVYPACVT
jgi:hypothetical protein